MLEFPAETLNDEEIKSKNGVIGGGKSTLVGAATAGVAGNKMRKAETTSELLAAGPKLKR